MNKILLFGPKFNKNEPSNVGGIIVLFEDLLMQLEKENINFEVIDTNKENYSNKIIAFFYIYLKFLINVKKIDNISIHGTAKDYLFLAPFIIFISKIFNKKISTRKFAGNFHSIFNNYNLIFKILIKYVLKNSDTNFFETKELVSYFSEHNKNTYWFPNVRDITQKNLNEKIYSKKFVFISSVKKTKGINEIINAFKELPLDFTIDIFGPIQDKDITKEKIEISSNIKYHGAIESKYVIDTLENYDILILPTYHEGEGYPGIIIEAFALGMPVITTNWNAIPEIVNHNINGLIIEPKDYIQLKNTILNIKENEFESLRKEAYKSFSNFSSDLQTKVYLERINLL